jgi:hypothetical protein
MKIRKLGNIVFFVVTLLVFAAGTIFTLAHRYNPNASIFSRDNILAIAAASFLTVAELAFIFLHGLLDSRQLWRRIASYVLSLGLIATITYATYTEASAYMQEGSAAAKANIINESNITRSQRTRELRSVLRDMKTTEFAPFAINFLYGLFCIVTGTLIQPREPWTRRRGNQMSPQVRAAAQSKIGFVPETAKAYDDGKGYTMVIKNGREYLGTISKKDITE